MKKINIYTDLALEERERFKRNIEISGVKIDKNYNKELFMTTTDVEIFNENGAKSMGKPIGSYEQWKQDFLRKMIWRGKIFLQKK